MNMDEIQEHKKHFAEGLEELDKTLRSSFSALEAAHREVEPLWHDSMRQQYDAVWLTLEEETNRYLHQVFPELSELLEVQLSHGEGYRHGQS